VVIPNCQRAISKASKAVPNFARSNFYIT